MVVGISACEVDNYDCYTFEVRTEITYIPYRPTQVYYCTYDRCNMTYYMAQQQALSEETTYSYYSNGYYITEYTTCTFYRSW